MQFVPEQWYKRLNLVFLGISFLALGFYGLSEYVLDLDPHTFGLSTVSLVVAVLNVVYFAFAFPVLKNKHPYLLGVIGYILFAALSLALIISSGNSGSPLFFMWILVVFLSGAFGVASIALSIALTLMYLLLTYFEIIGDSVNSNMSILVGAISIATSLVSLEVWRHMYGETGSNDHMSKLSRELQTEQVKSEILINAVADGMIAIDSNNKIQVFNPAAERITGWSAGEALGIDYNIVIKLFKVDKDQEVPLTDTEHPFVQATQKEQSVASEPILHTKNDKSLELALTVSPITTDSKIQGLVVVFRDVSEQKKQERQRTEFISTASHEMRTPVAAIEGYLSLAMNDKVASIDSKAREYLVKAHDSTQHLGQLFKDLLAAAKSEDGRIQSHPEVIELGDYLSKLTEDLRFTAEDKGLRLDYVVATGGTGGEQIVSPLFYVNIDPERLREVIINLVNNAIKFTEKGNVAIGLRGEKDNVQITVQDSGFGIPEEDIPHLFQKFYRVDNSATRTIGGTGLGLFISRNIVEMYNGRIWVESKVNEGSTFYINLPRLSSQQADSLKRQQESLAPPITVHQNSL